MKRNTLDREHQTTHDQVHHAGIREAPAEDKYHRNGNRCRVGKTGKSILNGNQPYQNTQDEPHESDHVITYPSPSEQSKNTDKN